MPIAPYVREANAQTFVDVPIKDPESLANSDAIAAVEGVDVLFLGPFGFTFDGSF